MGPIIIIGLWHLWLAAWRISFRKCTIRQVPNTDIPKASAEPTMNVERKIYCLPSTESSTNLRAEMEMALKFGGISPTFGQSREIDTLSAKGVDVTGLRTP